MNILSHITAILQKPFPEDESRFGAPKTITAVSLFIVFFLYVFQPFGINTLESNKFFVCLGFGSMTFFATIIYEFIVGELLQLKGTRDNWKFWKWIVNNLGIMLSISLANFLFARLVLFGYVEWSLFPTMVYATFMIGIIPVVVLGAWSVMHQEKKYEKLAKEIKIREETSDHHVEETEVIIFDIPVHQIKFAEALQNYVRIGYIDQEGRYHLKTERSTLKYILSETQGSALRRCHRSFLVNRDAIISVRGNAQGLLLTLSDCDATVPVSRSYVPAFKAQNIA